MKAQDRIGQTFNRLKIVGLTKLHERTYFVCQCSCGTTKPVKMSHVTSGRTKSCGCYGLESRIAIGKSNKGRRLPDALAAKRVLFGRYSSDIRGYDFQLSFENFIKITSSNCFYCDAKPNKFCRPKKSQQDGYWYNGIDRLDNRNGYVEGNVVPCCFACNSKKGTFSVSEFVTWMKTVLNNLESKGVK